MRILAAFLLFSLLQIVFGNVLPTPRNAGMGISFTEEEWETAVQAVLDGDLDNDDQGGEGGLEWDPDLLFRRRTRNYDLWSGFDPNGVPISFDPEFPRDAYELFLKALAHINLNSCVRFISPSGDPQELRIFVTHTDPFGGCFQSWRNWPREPVALINIAIPGCDSHSTMVHEVLHAFGANHEHKRPDVDEYMKVNWEHITEYWAPQYWKDRLPGDNRLPFCRRTGINFTDYSGCTSGTEVSVTGPYDYASIMHYRAGREFTCLKPCPLVRSSTVMTTWDVRKFNTKMECPLVDGKWSQWGPWILGKRERVCLGREGTCSGPTVQLWWSTDWSDDPQRPGFVSRTRNCADPCTDITVEREKLCQENGESCTFPFTYNGVEYTHCSTTNSDRPWCSVDAEYSGRWGYCDRCSAQYSDWTDWFKDPNIVGHQSRTRTCNESRQDRCNAHTKESVKECPIGGGECRFPFDYRSVTYDHCTDVDNDGKDWCYKRSGGYDNCGQCGEPTLDLP